MTDTLRDTIERAAAHHANDSPYTDELPPNANFLGRPPVPSDMSTATDEELAAIPHLRGALATGRMHPDAAMDAVLEMRQFMRAERGDRALPGEYLGRRDLPYLPMPFEPREQHRPDRLPGTPAHAAMRAAQDDIERDEVQAGLTAQMGTTAQVQAIEEREDDEPPSLHDSLAAAFEIHAGEDHA